VGDLRVDVAGLRAAATASSELATDVAVGDAGGSTTPHPSGGGVTAVDTAITATRRRQSTRISSQADGLSTGAGRYEHTDDDGAAGITTVSV
jgi:hypothetical protein